MQIQMHIVRLKRSLQVGETSESINVETRFKYIYLHTYIYCIYTTAVFPPGSTVQFSSVRYTLERLFFTFPL